MGCMTGGVNKGKEGLRKRWTQDRRDVGREGCSIGVMYVRTKRFWIGGMQGVGIRMRWDAGQERYRKGGTKTRRNEGQEEDRIGGMQVRNVGKAGCNVSKFPLRETR